MICEHELELDNLRRAITRQREWSPELRLWGGEARMLALLYKRTGVRPEALAAVLSGDGNSSNESVRVQLSRLRKKLPPGTSIENINGFYCLIGKGIIQKYIVRI